MRTTPISLCRSRSTVKTPRGWATWRTSSSGTNLRPPSTSCSAAAALGMSMGGGAGGGYQELFMGADAERWEAAWEALRTLLAERRLIDDATVTLTLPGQQAHPLWPSQPA
jgi:hypothetical protein